MAKPREVPFRWTVARACREYNIDRKTLDKRLAASDQLPGTDGFYSSLQILIALSGDLEAEKIRKTRAEANLAELKEAKIRREVVDLATVQTVTRNFMIAARAAIMGQDIDARAKQKIVQAIKDIPDEAYISDEDEDETISDSPAN